MSVRADDLAGVDAEPARWPGWVFDAPYDGAMHPQAVSRRPLSEGANCQRYAYSFLRLFDRSVPPHRSSELWHDPTFVHVDVDAVADLDLMLFNASADPWGAHVGVVVGGRVLHLSREVGRPALWDWADFAARERYSVRIGAVRIDAGRA